jgi:hypothetical protein
LYAQMQLVLNCNYLVGEYIMNLIVNSKLKIEFYNKNQNLTQII